MFTALRQCHTQHINPILGINTTPVWSQISSAGTNLDRSYENSVKETRLWGANSE